MSLERLSFSLRLAVRSPFLFRGTEGRFVGVDVTQIRDEAGRPIIPADQVRGVFREALQHLETCGALPTTTVDDLFGRPSASPEEDPVGANEPDRGKILFADLRATKQIADPDDRASKEVDFKVEGRRETTRIAIDDDTGSVKAGALQVLDLVAPFGAAVVFEGEIVLFAETSAAQGWERTLTKALALLQSIGAYKSPGYGEVLQSPFSSVKRMHSRALAVPATARALPERFRLAVTFDRPILVDAKKISGNAVEGRSVVPGAVFKGALARRLSLAGENTSEGSLAEALAAMSFGHAFPESKTEGEICERPLPLSLVSARDGDTQVIGDAALIGYDRGAMLGRRPALFQPDWKHKDFEAANAVLARPERWGEIPLIARTHTKIDTNGAAAEGMLFTTVSRSVTRLEKTIVSGKEETSWVDRRWLLEVDLGVSTGDQRRLAERLVECLLLEGLDGVGRTGAHAAFDLVGAVRPPVPAPVLGYTDLWAIVLETPAWMLDAAAIDRGGEAPLSARSAYESYWQNVIPGAQLVNFYAVQDYKGGYLARRRRVYGKGYFPFLLTREGSTFFVRTRELSLLESFCRNGLPLPELQHDRKVTWQNCPYVLENGYGRVSIDHLSSQTSAALLAAAQADDAGRAT